MKIALPANDPLDRRLTAYAALGVETLTVPHQLQTQYIARSPKPLTRFQIGRCSGANGSRSWFLQDLVTDVLTEAIDFRLQVTEEGIGAGETLLDTDGLQLHGGIRSGVGGKQQGGAFQCMGGATQCQGIVAAQSLMHLRQQARTLLQHQGGKFAQGLLFAADTSQRILEGHRGCVGLWLYKCPPGTD